METVAEDLVNLMYICATSGQKLRHYTNIFRFHQTLSQSLEVRPRQRSVRSETFNGKEVNDDDDQTDDERQSEHTAAKPQTKMLFRLQYGVVALSNPLTHQQKVILSKGRSGVWTS